MLLERIVERIPSGYGRILTELKPDERFLELVHELERERILKPAVEIGEEVIEETLPTSRILSFLSLLSEPIGVVMFEDYGTGKTHSLAFIENALRDREAFERRRERRKEILSSVERRYPRRIERIRRGLEVELPEAEVISIGKEKVEEEEELYKIVTKSALGFAVENPQDAAIALSKSFSKKLVLIVDEYQERLIKFGDKYIDNDISFFRSLVEFGNTVFISGNRPIGEKNKELVMRLEKRFEALDKALTRRLIPGDISFKHSELVALAAIEYDPRGVRRAYNIDMESIDATARRIARSGEEIVYRNLVRYLLTSLAIYYKDRLYEEIYFFPGTLPAILYKKLAIGERDYESLFEFLDYIVELKARAKHLVKPFVKALEVLISVPRKKLEAWYPEESLRVLRREISSLPIIKLSKEAYEIDTFLLELQEDVREILALYKLAKESREERKRLLEKAVLKLNRLLDLSLPRLNAEESKRLIEKVLEPLSRLNLSYELLEEPIGYPERLTKAYVFFDYEGLLLEILDKIVDNLKSLVTESGRKEIKRRIEEKLKDTREYVCVYFPERLGGKVCGDDISAAVRRIENEIVRELKRAALKVFERASRSVSLEEIVAEALNYIPKEIPEKLVEDIAKKHIPELEALRVSGIKKISFSGGAFRLERYSPEAEMESYLSEKIKEVKRKLSRKERIDVERIFRDIASKAASYGLDPKDYKTVLKTKLKSLDLDEYVGTYRVKDKIVLSDAKTVIEMERGSIVHRSRLYKLYEGTFKSVLREALRGLSYKSSEEEIREAIREALEEKLEIRLDVPEIEEALMREARKRVTPRPKERPHKARHRVKIVIDGIEEERELDEEAFKELLRLLKKIGFFLS